MKYTRSRRYQGLAEGHESTLAFQTQTQEVDSIYHIIEPIQEQITYQFIHAITLLYHISFPLSPTQSLLPKQVLKSGI